MNKNVVCCSSDKYLKGLNKAYIKLIKPVAYFV